jgi:hypothetical protein
MSVPCHILAVVNRATHLNDIRSIQTIDTIHSKNAPLLWKHNIVRDPEVTGLNEESA